MIIHTNKLLAAGDIIKPPGFPSSYEIGMVYNCYRRSGLVRMGQLLGMKSMVSIVDHDIIFIRKTKLL